MAKVTEKEPTKKALHHEMIQQLTTLSAAGFGLVAALAWNDAVQSFFKTYIEPYVQGSGVWWKFIYAFLVTILIVIITVQLSRLSARFEPSEK